MRILPVLVLSSLVSLSGCAAANRFAQPSYKVVAASSVDQPRWIEATSSEDARYRFFVGRADVAADLSSGEAQAEAQAKDYLRGELREQLRRDFEASLGASLPGKREALDRALTASLGELELKGLVPVDRYWERLEVSVDDGMRYGYRLALRLRISKEGYEATRLRAQRAVASQIGL